MGYIERQSKELYEYLPPLTKEPDFDAFWEETLKQTKSEPLNAKIEKVEYMSPYIELYNVTFDGFGSFPIKAIYMVPTFVEKKDLPCFVNFHGFTDSKGTPVDFMPWLMMGMAVFSMDCREQSGDTGNCAHSGALVGNVVTKGILDKYEYYFRAVYMDCIKALDFVCQQKEINKERIVIHGASQGGALTMATAALDDRPYLAIADIPSNCNFEERVKEAQGSFSAITDYLRLYPERTDTALSTLSYFDNMNLADRIKCKLFAQVGLRDEICPAKWYFAAYNRVTSEKSIRINPFGVHEVLRHQTEAKMKFLKENL